MTSAQEAFSFSFDDAGAFVGAYPSREAAAREAHKLNPVAEFVFTAVNVPVSADSLVDLDAVIWALTDAADEQHGELADGWLVNVVPEHKAELRQLVAAWIERTEPPKFFRVTRVEQSLNGPWGQA